MIAAEIRSRRLIAGALAGEQNSGLVVDQNSEVPFVVRLLAWSGDICSGVSSGACRTRAG